MKRHAIRLRCGAKCEVVHAGAISACVGDYTRSRGAARSVPSRRRSLRGPHPSRSEPPGRSAAARAGLRPCW
eukprot:2965058-Prymnesium_polylepis.1